LAPPWSEKWSDPLTDVQRRLFEHATSGKSGDAAVFGFTYLFNLETGVARRKGVYR
jgi:hypothetical protein